MPTDELCQGLVEAEHDIIFQYNILESMFNITQKFPEILNNFQKDLRVYSGFDQLAIIKGKIIEKTWTPFIYLT